MIDATVIRTKKIKLNKSGTTVNLSHLKLLTTFALSSENISLANYVFEEYTLYLRKLYILGNHNNINNIFMEQYLNSGGNRKGFSNAIDYFKYIINYDDKISINSLNMINSMILNKGIDSLDVHTYRLNNLGVVGSIVGDQTSVLYRGVDYRHTPIVLNYICDLWNNHSIENNYDLLLRPILCSLIISIFQCYTDANTRLSSLLRDSLIWKLSHRNLDYPCQEPLLLLSTLNKSKIKLDVLRRYTINIVNTKDEYIINQYIKTILHCISKQLECNTLIIENNLQKNRLR